jgi:hypothetical protein
LSRPKDEVLDSLSEFFNALGTGDVSHVVLVSLDDRRHFYLAVVFWNVALMVLASWDRKAYGYFPCTMIVNTISYD